MNLNEIFNTFSSSIILYMLTIIISVIMFFFNPFSRFKRKKGDASKIPASCTECGRIMPSDEIAEHLNTYHTKKQKEQHK